MGPVVLGFTLLLLGAVCGGSFGLPSKFVGKSTPWETLWGPFFVLVTILLPTAVFPLVADGLFAACLNAGLWRVLMPVLFGFLWGLGSMTLGLSFALIGLSLAYALNYGAQIATGGIGPLLIHHRHELATAHGCVIVAGVAVCVLGVVACGRAATLRSRSQATAETSGTVLTGSRLIKGLVLAIASGVLCACYGIAVSFGGPVMEIAEQSYGNPDWRAAFVVAALILWGGSISACGYCAFKLCRNKTWATLVRPGIGRVLFIALIMACLHDGAILLFGMSVPKLGTQTFGAAIAYPAFMSFAIIVGNVNGFLTGEWRAADRKSRAWILAGIAVLIIGVSILAKGQSMQAAYQRAHSAPAAHANQ